MLRKWVGAILVSAIAATGASAAVFVAVNEPQIVKTGDGERFVQEVTLANEHAHYTLNYDIRRSPDKPGEITSHWWQWEQGYIPIGMTAPSKANWYWQAFMRWTFDGESLHTLPATLRVIRESGPDGMIEYSWDAPKARVWLRLAMVTGSDKLLMFGGFEPKEPVQNSRLSLTCYPATFALPRSRAVTTVEGTRLPGETIEMDLELERWALYEDTLAGRTASGSSGLIIGTPEVFNAITIPVTEYGVLTTLDLPTDGSTFALGLYDFPTLPDYKVTRKYFQSAADAEALALGEMASGDLDEPLPEQEMDPDRVARIQAEGRTRFERPTEIWRPDPDPLTFSWAASLPGEPIQTAIFCRRWAAWETMELARRLEMSAEHIYFDARDAISSNNAWPYRHSTGDFAIPRGVASMKAATIARNEQMDLAIVAGIFADAIPGVARTALLEQVAEGKGLLIVGPPAQLRGWPDDLFATPDPGLSEEILAGFDWEAIPGYRPGERGRVGDGLPVRAYSYGAGHVVHLSINLNTYSTLVPRNDATEGLDGATDRCLAIAARCALGAVERLPVASFADAHSLSIRVQDDLDRVLASYTEEVVADAAPSALEPRAGLTWFADTVARNAAGECIGFSSRVEIGAEGPTLSDITIDPSTVTHEPAPPLVDMPEGGSVKMAVTLADAPDGAQVRFEVRDAFERVVAQASVPATVGVVTVDLELPRPVTVCHLVDVSVVDGETAMSFERKRFTMTVPYSYDDFTALMWTYAGGDPLLQRTDRMCYEMGAEMSDLCHMGGYNDEGAAREYAVSARSGMRMIPYVTRLSGSANSDNTRAPCLHDPERTARLEESLTTTCRQAAPYSPAAYTLGDENYLFRGENECCHTPESIAAFRDWLAAKYGAVANLNAAWATDYADFEDFERPMILAEAGEQTTSFAPWIDHKLFMDASFANAHDTYAEFIRSVDPSAKVGWDGFLGYTWRAGYDMEALTRNLEMNQTYTVRWLQGELYRSFKRPDALTGKWGNRVGDTRGGWAALPWDCLFAGDQSVWWWTSWGCDYIPFLPDLSVNEYGRQFFEAVREVASGPGKLLLNGTREHSGIGVLYSQRDLFAAAIVGEQVESGTLSGDTNLLREHQALLRTMRDLGFDYQHISAGELDRGRLSVDDLPVFVMPLAYCISDETAALLREYVEAGGTLIVDGRAGMLTGDGRIRDDRPLDELLGIASPAGPEAIATASAQVTGQIAGEVVGVGGTRALDLGEGGFEVLEPGITVTTGQALAELDGTPVAIVNEVGAGRTITLNLSMHKTLSHRLEAVAEPLHDLLDTVIRAANIESACEVTLAGGGRPKCSQQSLFTDGRATYIGVQADILVYDIANQSVRITLPEPSIVYDMRAGKQVRKGEITEWKATLSRGKPLLYALLPYRVRQVQAEAPRSGNRGETVTVGATVETSGEAGYHVVRLDVYAPGSDTPHRQYSQNIACERGSGSVDIPFALNDSAGEWRIRLRDAATGVTQTRTMELK